MLAGIDDVTDQVNADVKPEMSDAEAALARRKAMARIEQESLERTGLRSNVITLYQGGSVPPLHLQEVHRRPAGVRA